MNKFFVIFVLLLNMYCCAEKLPKVSVIVSVENSDDYIEDFLFSMSRQTIFSECEFLLYAHDSQEYEHAVINRYVKKFPQIIYIASRMDIDLWHIRTIAQAPQLVFLEVQKTYPANFLESFLDKEKSEYNGSISYEALFENDKKPIFQSKNSI